MADWLSERDRERERGVYSSWRSVERERKEESVEGGK